MSPAVRPSPVARVLRNAVRGALVVWAAFWAWFVVAVSLGEPPPPPLWIPAAWLGSLAALVALAWRRPALGGVALIGAGLAALFLFRDSSAWGLLALPAIALGLASFAVEMGARSLAGAALVLLCVALAACRAPQRSEDLPYRTSSILRHADGSLKRGLLVEETEVEGLPCTGYLWRHANGRLDSVELARDLVVQGHAFPARTRVFFDEEGRLAHAWLSRDTEIDGLPCRGRWKVDTAFHPNGRVRAFFPPETIELDGVACAASVFAPVYLHDDGTLQRCRLAREVTLAGRTFARGATLELDASGRPLASR